MIDPAPFELLHVSTSDDGAVVHLRLNHGKANEVGTAVLDELEALTALLNHDPDVRALITHSDKVTSRGTAVFVAGADVNERVGWTNARVRAHVHRQRDLLAGLRDTPVFHVVVAHGIAFGWGTEYLLTADYRLATAGARFALPETGLGIVPGAGGTSALASEIGVAHTLRLGMTGEAIEADEAQRIGLIQEVHTDLGAGLARAEALARKAATRSPTANAVFKQAVRSSIGHEAMERVRFEEEAYDHCIESGEAAIGREHFGASRRGETVPWGPKKLPDAD